MQAAGVVFLDDKPVLRDDRTFRLWFSRVLEISFANIFLEGHKLRLSFSEEAFQDDSYSFKRPRKNVDVLTGPLLDSQDVIQIFFVILARSARNLARLASEVWEFPR